MSSGLTKKDIKTIIQVLGKYPEVETAVLYGSRAMGTYQRGSDIDIALKGGKLTSSICSHIHFELEEETLLPYFFDITDYQSIKNEKLKEHIDRVGKIIYGIDNGEWQECFLDEIIEIVGGGTPKTSVEEYWSGNIPWLSVVDFGNDNRWVFKTEKSITEIGLKNSSTKLLNKGDLIISARGTVGELAQLSGAMAFNQSCYGLRAKFPLSNAYLYYLLKYNLQKLKKNTHGSVFNTITRDTFKNIDVKYPASKNEINKIENTLSCIDLKIDNLQRQNQILEKIAQTLFKQWFVDFNFPDENGKSYKDSGGEMVGSELGEIPGGWMVKKLGNCLKALIDNRGKTPKFVESGIPALSAKFVKNGNLINRDKFNFVLHDLFNQSEKLLIGDIIMTSEAPLGELYYISENTKYYPAQRVFAMRADQQVVLPSYLYFWLDSFVGQYLVKRRGSGSTVQGIKQSELKECEVIIPDWRLIELADSSLKIILLKKEKNETQIQILAKTRDTLLPKLMSGQIRVSD
ncbi:MAG: restriction endonuclease subunit S [Desulfobacula sp.]|uniref:restriction endonuclease subunit S n=1 Tax=Desulfobacula sp. TaxID=2593537 RepID=UPI0025C3AD75|nr:restriction endonuclease subunit S [Desulfobacula sp.]MCD4721810.1 restriction endonuclease subunit S [Desulfobacula sp.]